MAVTITDVANAAGVSKSTVSKVLNDSPTISENTKENVRRVIKELKFIPNMRAVSFARRNTKNIVYLTDLSSRVAYKNPHMFEILCGVYDGLASSGHTLTLVDTSGEAFAGETALHEIERHSADGLIIHGSAVGEDLAREIIKENIPHIIIGHPGFDSRLSWVDTDHTAAGEFAAKKLLSDGYRDICYIAGRRKDELSNLRIKGFSKGLLHENVHLDKKRIGYTENSWESAYQVTQSLFSERIPEAVCCGNSELAIGVMRSIHAMGLSVPSDIGVILFDAFPYAGIITPKPTVIDIDMHDIGHQAGLLMVRKLIEPDLLIQSNTALPHLIHGETTRRIG